MKMFFCFESQPIGYRGISRYEGGSRDPDRLNRLIPLQHKTGR